MKTKLSKKEVEKKIEDNFKKDELKTEDVKKIKRLAMKFKIRLGQHRKRFCKKCYSDLKNSKTRIRQGIKLVLCSECGHIHRWKV